MAQDSPFYPDDADGDSLRLVAEGGSDMSKPMCIDFAIDAPTETVADLCITFLADRDFHTEKSENDDGRWTVTIPVIMTPAYEEIVLFQNVLDEDLAQFGAKSDGWGTFGNNPSNLSDDLKEALK